MQGWWWWWGGKLWISSSTTTIKEAKFSFSHCWCVCLCVCEPIWEWIFDKIKHTHHTGFLFVVKLENLYQFFDLVHHHLCFRWRKTFFFCCLWCDLKKILFEKNRICFFSVRTLSEYINFRMWCVCFQKGDVKINNFPYSHCVCFVMILFISFFFCLFQKQNWFHHHQYDISSTNNNCTCSLCFASNHHH